MRTFFKPRPDQALAAKLQNEGPLCQQVAKTIAARIGVPNYENRIGERLLGYRWREFPNKPFERGHRFGLVGPIKDGKIHDTWPMDPDTGKPAEMKHVAWLTEEVWSRENWPHTADDPNAAVARLTDGQITGIYYHGPSMCLVLLHPGGGLRVGVRAASIIHPRIGLDDKALGVLSKLKKWEGPVNEPFRAS